MATSNSFAGIPAGEIVAKYVNVNSLNERLYNAINRLSFELNSEAAAQFSEDAKAAAIAVSGSGTSVSGELYVPESYLLNYLQNHDTPVTGGDGGTAHNVDGSTYQSQVPANRWGIELGFLSLPIVDIKEEAEHLAPIILKDEIELNAVPASSDELSEQIKPVVTEYVANYMGGMFQ